MDPVLDEIATNTNYDETIDLGARTIQFKSFYWSFEETNDHDEPNELLIHVGGRSLDGKSVHCVIEHFPPFVYLELPKRIRWNKAKCMTVFEYLKRTMKSNGPLSYQLLQKYNLYYLDEMNTMCLSFPTHKASDSLAKKCRARTGVSIEGVGTFRPGELVVHLHNIDPIIKFTAAKMIELAGLLTVTETIPEDEVGLSIEDRKFTTADIDLRCKWEDIDPYKPDDALSLVINSLFFTFDIECYSRNHNSRLPDPTDPANVIFSISIVVGDYGGPRDERKKILLSLCNPKDIKDVVVKRFVTEREMLLKFRSYIEEINPDALCTYNGMKFDWNYMITRAEKLGIYIKFAQISRVIGKRAELKTVNWSSSAYGDQIFRYLDPCGRSNVDVLIEVERNYKLIKYSLDYVAGFFLNEHKEDVTPRQLFMLYQLTVEMTPIFNELEDGVIEREVRIELKKKVQTLLPRRRCHGEVLKIRTNLMNAKTGKQFKSFIRDPLTLTGFYNVQDSVLTIDLCEKLNLWTTMESMSNTMNVPMSYLHTRGQQIKVLAQVYRETIFEDIVIPCKPKPKEEDLEKYQGAVVIEANPGDYDNVVCFDFESLYPSVMIAFNICYTTLLRDDDPTPDDECHVLEWGDHVGCPEDPQHRKKKAADVLCKDHHYRFRKVVTLPDGTRVHEGVMPKLERKLLGARKGVKKEMAKLEAKLKMVLGTAMEDDISYYKKVGWEIVEKDSLTPQQITVLKVGIKVLNAKQLSLKISSNSAYGGLGAQMGFIPLVPGAASVTAKGRELIMDAIRYVLEKYPGVAKLVYGDTDSSMMTFVDKTTDESFLLGDRISKEISHYLKTKLIGLEEEYMITNPIDNIAYRIDKYPRAGLIESELEDLYKIQIHEYDANPINLQFENLYKRYFLLTKKRYVARATNRAGKITAKIKKGVVLARRDNCMYLKDTYEPMVEAIMDKKPEAEVMEILYDQIHKLFTRQIPDANLIKYVGVKNIMHYARKKEKKQGRTVLDRVYVDAADEPIEEPTGPLDLRLIYPNLPQVMLAIKMMVRGDDVPPNTRLEYILVENDKAEHQGEHAEDYTFYRENKHAPFIDRGTGDVSFAPPKGEPYTNGPPREVKVLKPDYLMYIDKQLVKPIMEMINVKYPKELIPFEKIEDAFNRCVETLSDLLRHRVKAVKTYERKATSGSTAGLVGWETICEKCEASQGALGRVCIKHISMLKGRTAPVRVYKYKGVQAQIQYILDSVARKRYNPGIKNEIDSSPGSPHLELIKVCLAWKSRTILDKIHSSFAVRKRTIRKPTQTGTKLPVMTANVYNNAFLTKNTASSTPLEVYLNKIILLKDPDLQTGVESTVTGGTLQEMLTHSLRVFEESETTIGNIQELRERFIELLSPLFDFENGRFQSPLIIEKLGFERIYEGLKVLASMVPKGSTYPRGTMVTLQDIVALDDGIPTGRGKQKKKYEYTVKLTTPGRGPGVVGEVKIKGEAGDVIFTHVPRANLTSYRVRDSKIMRDILLYRTQYKMIVRQLDQCLSSSNFVGMALKEIKLPDENEIGADGDFFIDEDDH
jgi:DNA polymerase delta subunit 1